MSFEDVWALPEGPLDVARLRTVLSHLSAWLQIEFRVLPRGSSVAVDVKVQVAKNRILEVLRMLDPQSFVFTLSGERLAQEIEPPRDPDADHYQLFITLYEGDEERAPSISLYSNESDNRRVWAVAHTLFRNVADRMGAEPIEDAMLWDPSAILRPQN